MQLEIVELVEDELVVDDPSESVEEVVPEGLEVVELVVEEVVEGAPVPWENAR